MVEGEQQQGRLSFPDFLWLLRDVDTLPTGADGSQLSPTQLVEKMLKTSKLSGGSFILQYFPSFHCLTIPPPSTDPAILSEITSCLDKLSPQFNKGVDAAIEHILNTVRVKVGYDSSMKCDGRMLACLLEQHFTLIKNSESEIPNLQVSWQMAVELRIKRIADSLVSEYVRDMRAEMKARLPMRPGLNGETGETLMNIHLQVIAKKRLELQESISPYRSQSSSDKLSVMECELIAYFDRSVAEFNSQRKVIGGRLFDFIQDNMKSSEEFCTSLYNKKYDAMVQVKLRNSLSTQIPTTIDQELSEFCDAYFKEASGPSIYQVFKRMRSFSSELESHLKLIPGPVQELMVVGVDADRVKVQWTPPEINPMAVELYQVLIKSKRKDWEVVASLTRKSCSALVVGLRSSSWYCLSVRAKNTQYLGNKVQFVRVRTLLSKSIQKTVQASSIVASPVVYPCMVAYAASGHISKGIMTKSPLDVIGGGLMLTLLPATAVIGVTPIAGQLASNDQYNKVIGDQLGDLSEDDTEVLQWNGGANSVADDDSQECDQASALEQLQDLDESIGKTDDNFGELTS